LVISYAGYLKQLLIPVLTRYGARSAFLWYCGPTNKQQNNKPTNRLTKLN
jgi:hypothetical protein